MIFSWLTYSLLVATLVSLGAVVAERAARAQRWPTRWVWAGAMLVTAGLPLATWLGPVSPDPGPLPMLSAVYVLESLPVAGGAPASAGLTGGQVALLSWAMVTAGLLLWVAVLAFRLRAAGRRWRRGRVEGVEVLVSRRTGPAAMGVLRGRVVVPEWVLSMDDRRRRLLVLHEAEHVGAGDPQLAAAGLIVCALVPWLLPLWWQLARLRLAIEVDCDARVLRRDGDARGYGSLLLEVGQRRASLAVALMESRTMLERRIRMITTMTTGRRTARAVGLAAVAGVLVAVACETPGPTELASPERSEPSLAEVQEEGAMGCEPLVYVNGAASTQSALGGLDPDRIESVNVFKGPAVRDLPGGGDAASPTGSGDGACGVISVLTKDASAAEQARVREMAERLTAERTRERQPQTLAEVEGRPTFTPMDERPSLRNADEVVEALKANYPPLLREAGIGGTANVWMLIDADGTMQKMQINRSSGRDELDAAALRTAAIMRFSPARLKGEPVPVWFALDVRFETQ